MKKEYYVVFVIGLFLLAYALEAMVRPLGLHLANPYAYIDPTLLAKYPFTTLIIVLRSIALFLSPLLLLSFIKGQHFLKAIVLIFASGLSQLYAIQAIATGTQPITIEWSLSLSLAGIALLLPISYELIIGIILGAHKKIKNTLLTPSEKQE